MIDQTEYEIIDVSDVEKSSDDIVEKLSKGGRIAVYRDGEPLFAVISNEDLRLLLCLEIETAESEDDEVLDALENIIDGERPHAQDS